MNQGVLNIVRINANQILERHARELVGACFDVVAHGETARITGFGTQEEVAKQVAKAFSERPGWNARVAQDEGQFFVELDA